MPEPCRGIGEWRDGDLGFRTPWDQSQQERWGGRNLDKGCTVPGLEEQVTEKARFLCLQCTHSATHAHNRHKPFLTGSFPFHRGGN